MQKNSRKLVMIEPRAPGRHIYSRMRLPRLGATLLATLANRRGWDCTVYVEDVAPVDWKEVLTADLVGISTITGTASRAYAMADALRGHGKPVIMGGPHVTFRSEEALAHCDWVLRGEAEHTFMRFLDAFSKGGPFRDIPALSYRDAENQTVHNPPPEESVCLDDMPAPDFRLIAGWDKAAGIGSEPIVPVQVSRGCPFGCTFCSVIGMFGRRLRVRSRDHVMAELEKWRGQKVHIFFYDDNFTADRRSARELLNAMAASPGLYSSWSSQVRTDCARDPELLRLMHASRCSNVFIGFESVNPAVLKSTRKQQSVEDMRRAVKQFSDARIDVHGMFVFGFDEDTPAMMDATVDFAVSSGIWSAQFLILTPFPGTPLYDEFDAAGRIRIHDWSFYDAHHAVFEPARISRLALQKAQLSAHERFYSARRFASSLLSRDFVRGALFLYAQKLNRDWRRDNRIYLDALSAEQDPRLAMDWDMRYRFSDIPEALGSAARQLQAAARQNLETRPANTR